MICCPDLNQAGGVANYYRIIAKQIGDDPNYGFFQAGGASRSSLGLLCALIYEPFFFLRTLIGGRYHGVLLNPSLLPRAILRNAAFVFLARMLGKKVIVFWRGFNLEVEKRIERSWRWPFSLIFNRADLSIVLAREFKDKLQQLQISHPVIVSTTVIDQAQMPVTNCGLGHGATKRILFLSRVERNKGIHEALAAFHLLRQADPEVTIDVVGDGPELSDIRAQYRNLQGVTWHGYLDDRQKMPLLEGAGVFVFPSYTEGMPNCVLEAMACGLPVVTTAVGGLKDFFIDGEHGFFVEQQSPQQLADRVARILGDPDLHAAISTRNFVFARAHFSAPKATDFIRSLAAAAATDSEHDLPVFWNEGYF